MKQWYALYVFFKFLQADAFAPSDISGNNWHKTKYVNSRFCFAAPDMHLRLN